MEWSNRFPRIREALASLGARSITIDGEAVVLCPETGFSLFEELHLGRCDHDVILYAFDLLDLLELNGKDQRSLPLEERKARLADLLTPAVDGIELTEHIEGDGATVFRHACKPGCEGIVSKQRASSRYSRSKITLAAVCALQFLIGHRAIGNHKDPRGAFATSIDRRELVP